MRCKDNTDIHLMHRVLSLLIRFHCDTHVYVCKRIVDQAFFLRIRPKVLQKTHLAFISRLARFRKPLWSYMKCERA